MVVSLVRLPQLRLSEQVAHLALSRPFPELGHCQRLVYIKLRIHQFKRKQNMYLTDSSVDMPRTVLGRGESKGGKQAEFELTESRVDNAWEGQPVLAQHSAIRWALDPPHILRDDN